MALFDLPIAQLREYRPDITVPADLDEFWIRTLGESRAHDLDAVFEPVDTGYALVDSYDVTFSGFGGHRIRGWLHVPAGATGPLPTVVEFIGYGGGRGLAHQHVEYALAGWAHVIMDTRGQGTGWSAGDTPDPDAGAGAGGSTGPITRGILDPDTYYCRRVYVDAVRAIEAARTSRFVDPGRVAVTGISQGGGIAIAASALSAMDAAASTSPAAPALLGAAVDVPFLCHFERAITLTDNDPYHDVVRYLQRHRTDVERVYETLSYFDGATLARAATIPTLFSVALMDRTCAPSTVFAAYNAWAGEKSIEVYPFNEHEGGQEHHQRARLAWLAALFGG
ncbi:acetylxylan esterase [Marisediminicola senii]|uniref:acetylxylan esterase n=1 Tax=Marisediminicola senii TaxID=2711233 RepID=UPI0013EB5FAC|nr:acetylxylan esterase [Marisediminicola senii]